MIYCPNKRTKGWKELESAVGERLAYLLWHRNNGNPIDLAPNGNKSILFSDILNSNNGDRRKSIKDKSKYYLGDNFNLFNSDGSDSNGEPAHNDSRLSFLNDKAERVTIGNGISTIGVRLNEKIGPKKITHQATISSLASAGLDWSHVDFKIGSLPEYRISQINNLVVSGGVNGRECVYAEYAGENRFLFRFVNTFDLSDELNVDLNPLKRESSNDGEQLSLFSRDFDSESIRSMSGKSKKVLHEISSNLNKRFGIHFKIITPEQAAIILGVDEVHLPKGFYVRSIQTAYLVDGVFSETTPFHEIFGHPFLDIISAHSDTKGIYEALLREAESDSESVKHINDVYSDYSADDRNNELILHVLGKKIKAEYASSKLSVAFKRFIEFVSDFINKIFNKSNKYKYINPSISISKLSDYLLYGNGEINLLIGTDKNKFNEAASKAILLFGRGNLNSINNDTIDIKKIVKSAGEFEDILHNQIVSIGAPNANFLLSNIYASTFSIDNGSIYSDNGRLAGKYSLNGGLFDILNVSNGFSETDIAMAIINNSSSNIKILSSKYPGLYNSIAKNLPFQCISTGIVDGNDVIYYNPYVRNENSPTTNIRYERISPSKIYDKNISDFIEKTISGLKAQVHVLERTPKSSKEYIDKLRDLILDAESYDAMDFMLKFVDHAIDEVKKTSTRIDNLDSIMAAGGNIDASILNDINKNFLTLYSNIINSIYSIKSNYSGKYYSIPQKERIRLDKSIDTISASLQQIKGSMYNLVKYAYHNLLVEIGSASGSNTIDDRLGDNAYIEEDDVNMLQLALGSMVTSKSEQLRLLNVLVTNVNSSVTRKLESDGVISELYKAWANVRKSNPIASYSDVMEFDENGRATGYIVSSLLYGKLNKDYEEFKAHLKNKYSVSGFNSIPDDEDARREFIDEKEKWLVDHTERMFTPEYYKLKKSLSSAASESLEEADLRIRRFRLKFMDGNGVFRTEKMSPQEKSKLFDLRKERQSLFLTIRGNGEQKLVGTREYDIAIELQNFQKKLYENVKYVPNFNAFEEAKSLAMKSMDKHGYNSWIKDNTRTVYDDEFWELLSSVERAKQSPEWERLYEIRSQLLKLYRDPDTMDIKAEKIMSKDDIFSTINKIDEYLDANRVSSSDSSIKFSDIAMIVPTDEYIAKRDYLLSKLNTDAGKIEYDKWFSSTHYIAPNGKIQRHSYYNKITPINEKYIRIEPNQIWSEIDEASPYYNKNFDKSLEENGMQPKRSVYDNSKNYNKIVNNQPLMAFRDALIKAYKVANSNYFYIDNPSPLRLAQIPGGFLHRAMHGDGSRFLSGLRTAIADEFNYREYDEGLGDYDSSSMYYADGSPVTVVPTRYRKMLDNTNAISRDLLGSFARYYKAALTFKEMTERTPDIELILEGLKNTEIINDADKVKKAPGESMMYQKAKKYINSEVYFRDQANKYEVGFSTLNPYIMLRNLITGKRDSSGKLYKATLAKPLVNAMVPFIRAVNLGFNIKAITGNFAGAAVHQKIEASCGIYMNNKTYMAATGEVALSMPSVLKSVYDRSDNKIISMMRYFGVGRSNEEDMSNLHGSKLARAMSTHLWYGPYSAGDFAVKSTSMIAILMNIKLHDGKFYQKEQFITKFYPGDRANGELVFDSIKDNMYGAYEISDGIIRIKDKYADAITPDTENYISRLLHDVSRRLDGSLTGTEKTSLHKDVFGSMLLLHRNYLLWAVQERFHPEMFRYDKGMESIGMYRPKMLAKVPEIAIKLLASRLWNIATFGRSVDVTGVKDKFNSSYIYNTKRLVGELTSLLMLSFITIMASKMVGDDDEKRKFSAEMLTYILLLRTTLEMGSLLSPLELWNLQKNPSAAQSFFQQIKDMSDMFSDGSWDQPIDRGIYKNKTKLFRAATKMTPGWKNIYPTFVEPDLRNDERFMKQNVWSTYDLMDRFVYPDNPRRKNKSQQDDNQVQTESTGGF